MLWDYIIVGAGSSGCVLANRLSENKNNQVLLIEAGGSDRNPLQRIPALGALLNFGNKKTDWNYRTCPDPSRNNQVDIWPRGKMLGGSSSINGMIYVRGSRYDFDHWASLGNRGWGYDDVLPLFKKMENHQFHHNGSACAKYYGGNGNLRIQQMKGAHALSEEFVSACAEIGVPHNPDYNAATQEGACLLTMTQSRRIRHSAAQAFLQPAKRRHNLKILKNTLVTRVLLDGKRASGVAISTKNGAGRAEIFGRRIILSGGSINSPQLLMLSGIGPEDHLRDIGIPVHHHLPGVGKNLHEHASIIVRAKVNVPTLTQKTLAKNMAKGAFNWALYGKGQWMTGGFEALAFAKTRAALERPDIQIHFMPAGVIKHPNNTVQLMDYPCVTLHPNVNHPRSRGELKLASASPFDYPAIQPNMLAHEDDVATLVEAIKFCRQVVQSNTFAPYVEEETYPGPSTRGDEALAEYVRHNTVPVYHPVGTCKMGGDEMAVVDSSLKVHGIENLRVIDASIMPAIISGNTNAACMMIAEKGAAMLLAEQRGETS